MMRMVNEFKKGAASFYVIAFSTLILMIIAMSFAGVIISEVMRTSNDDLSQSAYDSALAGVEDAKIAFANYRNCKMLGATAEKPANMNNFSDVTCSTIVWLMEEGFDYTGADFNSCDMVSAMLGRTIGEGNAGTEINETGVPNNMSQSYTCVKIRNKLDNYIGTLSSSNSIKVVKVKFADYDGGTVSANDIDNVTIRWFSEENLIENGSQSRFNNIRNGKVTFPSLSGEALVPFALPPTISLTMLQTGAEFSLGDFETATSDNASGKTDRGTVYLVPYNGNNSNEVASSENTENNHKMAKFESNMNYIGADALNVSNSKKKNLPYAVRCSNGMAGNEFSCSANIKLPKPITKGNEGRNDDTFVFIVALPYGKPDTDFSLEFYCADGVTCSKVNSDGAPETDSNLAVLDGVQIEIDSTGRANDLYRRVKATLQSQDAYTLSIMGPLELFGNNGNGAVLEKNYSVKQEYGTY